MIILLKGLFEVIVNDIYEIGRPLAGDFCRVEKRMACFHMDAELYSEGSEMGYCPTCGQQDIYLTFVD